MSDDSKMNELEVTWTPATCEGLPPPKTRVAFQGTREIDSEKSAAWIVGRIGGYIPLNDEFFPATRPSDEPMIWFYENGYQFVGLPMPLELVTLLEMEKQPAGWPNHDLGANKPDLDILRSKHNLSKDALADMLKYWLKDNGYLKR